MKKQDNFRKFSDKKKNSAVKEQFRQEKKLWKKERAAAIDKKFELKRQSRQPARVLLGERAVHAQPLGYRLTLCNAQFGIGQERRAAGRRRL